MIKLIKKFSAAFCAAAVIITAGAESVFALPDEVMTLPSGHELQTVIGEFIDYDSTANGKSPEFGSAAIGIFQGDEVLYTGYFGEIDRLNHIPADEESVYEWGSISKTLIWVSAMQLYEQGRLDLETDVREYLPEGFFQHLKYDEPITMLNLMNHNAGWQETSLPVWKTDENDIGTLHDELQAIEPAQVNRPGEVAAYSNYGAAVAGYVIECITGTDYCQYVHENIFAPLGMEHTALDPTHSDNPWVYAQRARSRTYKTLLVTSIDLGSCLEYIPCYPAGAATGTLADLMTYARALVDDNAPLFRNAETQRLMFTGTDFYGDTDIPLNAHGFWPVEYSVRTYGHNGSTVAGTANMLFDLESKTGLVVLTNEQGANWFYEMAPTLVFGELSPRKYADINAPHEKIGGYYLMARSTHTGLLKCCPYLTATDLDMDVQSLGYDLYQLTGPADTVSFQEGSAMLIGKRHYPNGGFGLELSSSDFIYDKFVLLKICLLTAYMLSALAAFYILLIKRKLKKYRRRSQYAGSVFNTIGLAGRLISLLLLMAVFMIYYTYHGGVPYGVGAVIGILQMLCIAACTVSAAVSAADIIKGKNTAMLTARYALGLAADLIAIAAIVYFEMFKFWS